MLGVHECTVRKALRVGALQATHLGGRTLIPAAVVHTWLAEAAEIDTIARREAWQAQVQLGLPTRALRQHERIRQQELARAEKRQGAEYPALSTPYKPPGAQG